MFLLIFLLKVLAVCFLVSLLMFVIGYTFSGLWKYYNILDLLKDVIIGAMLAFSFSIAGAIIVCAIIYITQT